MNWLAIIAAAVAIFVVGFIWYGPLFGKAWMESTGMTEEKAKASNMPLIFGLSLVFAIIAAMFLSNNVTHDLENFATFKHGAFHGALIALMIGLPMLGTNALYEQKSFKYIFINVGYWVVSFAIMGGILNVWH